MSPKHNEEKISPLAPESFPPMPDIAGVALAAGACGLKKSGDSDLMVVELAPDTTAAGVFTRSLTASAPVQWSRKALRGGGQARGLIVNSGVDGLYRESYREMARLTAAHSTLVVDDTSSARFAGFGSASHANRQRIMPGPSKVRIERRDSESAPGFVAQHDGYARQFGLWHERAISLHDEGTRIEGRDRLVRNGKSGNPPQRQFDIRFHLHPVVRATREDHRSIHLATDQGESWLFTANRGDVLLEDSIHFAGIAGPVRSHQIVISALWPEIDRVEWVIRKT